MNKKNKLIANIFKNELKGIKKCLKEQEVQIADIKKNGFSKEIHKKNKDSMWTGLHYTQGYCTAHIFMTEKFLSILKLKEKEIKHLIKENEAIDAKNKAELKIIFDKIKNKIKENSDNSNDQKKKNKK
jgi:hypothetical protein